MLALLQIVDNPRQDVPLISVLRSPVFGFTPDRLAEIRAAVTGRETSMTPCRRTAARTYKAFLADAGPDCGTRRQDMSVHRLLWHIYNTLQRAGHLRRYGRAAASGGRI